MPPPAPAPRSHLALAFATVYIFWGSTYLAIRIGLETLPPFLMAGSRFLVAGLLLYLWARARNGPARPPTLRHWRAAAFVGGLLLLGGNGGVVWAQTRVPSALAALLVSFVPIWMVLLDAVRPGGTAPSRLTVLGIVLGLGGTAILLGPERLLGGGRIDPVGAAALVGATLSWALGSIASRGAALPRPPLLATAMEMTAGGALLLVLGLSLGEWRSLIPVDGISSRSVLAWAYLVVFGSLAGFTAYLWLLRHTTAARAATYAYVNPVVALILGAALGGEAITPRIALAATVIIAAVIAITWPGKEAQTVPARATSGSHLSHKVLADDSATG
jgi:drug/metabolite transporter (DMT)-like permease